MAKMPGEVIATLVHAVHTQHSAIDMLMAMLIRADPEFRPTQSGAIWEAVIDGHKALRDWMEWERANIHELSDDT